MTKCVVLLLLYLSITTNFLFIQRIRAKMIIFFNHEVWGTTKSEREVQLTLGCVSIGLRKPNLHSSAGLNLDRQLVVFVALSMAGISLWWKK